jgi:hypothetical protein
MKSMKRAMVDRSVMFYLTAVCADSAAVSRVAFRQPLWRMPAWVTICGSL